MLKFNSILDLIKAFADEQSCINYLEKLRWESGVISPFDAASKVYKCKGNKYRCKNTGKYFNVRTKTIFEGSKISLQNWFIGIYLYTSHKRGISSYQLAKDLNITQKSAWFMLSRLRYATEHESFVREFEGEVQADETFVGGKNKNRHWDKKVKNSQGRSFKDKVPVFGLVEKSTGMVKAITLTDTKAQTIQPLLLEHVKRGSHLMTDEWWAYKDSYKNFTHTFTDHRRKEYVGEDGTTTNAVECFWSHLKRSIIGVYYVVSKRHLQLYCNEAVFRYNTRKLNTDTRFEMFLKTIEEKRLTWQALTIKE